MTGVARRKKKKGKKGEDKKKAKEIKENGQLISVLILRSASILGSKSMMIDITFGLVDFGIFKPLAFREMQGPYWGHDSRVLRNQHAIIPVIFVEPVGDTEG